MSRALKIIDVDYRITSIIVPDGYELVTVFPSFNGDASPVNKIVLLKGTDERDSEEGEAGTGLEEGPQ